MEPFIYSAFPQYGLFFTELKLNIMSGNFRKVYASCVCISNDNVCYALLQEKKVRIQKKVKYKRKKKYQYKTDDI